MGKLIVVEGLDGSGKGTQSKLLAQSLKEKGLPVLEISFPDYKSESSALVKMYLGGKFGTRPDDVNAYAASLFYAVDRFSSYKEWGEYYQGGGIVVADRYTTSNAVHTSAAMSTLQICNAFELESRPPKYIEKWGLGSRLEH